MLQIVIFRAWLNIEYPHLATPIGPLIDKLLEAQKRANAGMPPVDDVGDEGLYRIAFGTEFSRSRP